MRKINKKYLITAGFTAAGLLGGYLYWHFIGCSSGSCAITSNWHTSTLIGGLMGYLIGDTLNDFLKKREKKEKEAEG
ncbi:MAG: hypothetical protein JW801_13045 [Bacteroidales bacterium]|nr:hypothetical protein [Bacteroidales bacterium]